MKKPTTKLVHAAILAAGPIIAALILVTFQTSGDPPSRKESWRYMDSGTSPDTEDTEDTDRPTLRQGTASDMVSGTLPD